MLSEIAIFVGLLLGFLVYWQLLRKYAVPLIYRCEYAGECELYRAGSYVCNRAANKKYCGKYEEFKRESG